MDIRTILLAVAVVLPGCASAQAAPSSQPDAQALAASLPQGAEFRSGGRTYRPVAGLRAALEGGAGTPGDSAAASAPAASVVGRRGAYVIYRESIGAPEARSAAELDRVTARSVVVNTRTGRLGVVNGVVNVDLRNVDDAPAIAAEYGLVVDRVARGIGAAFFLAPAGADLRAVQAKLARDPRVTAVDLDVKEDFPVPT